MKSNFYTKCDECNGEGGHNVYCCRGYDDEGVQDCACKGQGDWNDCSYCNGLGKVVSDEIEWNFDTLDEVDRHEHQKFYSIEGLGKYGKYIATAIYTKGEFDKIEDIEKIEKI